MVYLKIAAGEVHGNAAVLARMLGASRNSTPENGADSVWRQFTLSRLPRLPRGEGYTRREGR